MKTTLLITTLLLYASAVVSAQTANIHVAATVGGTSNLGFHDPIVGLGVGGDYRHKQIGLSGDLSLDRIKKTAGGSGFQMTGREAVRLFKDHFFVQGGTSESKYVVKLFSKSSFAPLAGVGYVAHNTIIETNFLADITSPNKARIIEGRVTFLLSHHVFLRLTAGVDNFKQGKVRMTGSATRIELGLWK